jgi:tetratricopeptide (TPR) repeat protein
MDETAKKQVELATAYYSKGRKLWSKGLWSKGSRDDALDFFRKALSIQEAVLGLYNKQTAKTYYWIGFALGQKQEYEKALVAYRRTLRIRLFLLGDNNASTEDVKRALKELWKEKVFDEGGIEQYLKGINEAVQYEIEARLLEKKGSFSRAIEAYENFLKIEEAAVGSFPLDIARIYARIANVHKTHQENEMAISAYRSALIIFSSKLGRNHLNSLDCITGIKACANSKGLSDSDIQRYATAVFDSISLEREGGQMLENGKFNIAIEKYEKALTLEEASFGNVSLTAAELHRGLASCYRCIGDYDRAIMELRTTLAIFIFECGSDHHNVIFCLRDVGNTMRLKGLDNAEVNKYLNTVSHSVKYERRGTNICKEGDYACAISEFQKAISLEVTGLGKYHLTQAALFENIGAAFKLQGKYDHAIANYRNALLIYQPRLGDYHNKTISTLNEMLIITKRMGFKDSELEEYQESALNSVTHELEGDTLLLEGQREKAIAAFQKAVESEENLLGQHHLCTSDLYRKIADNLKYMKEIDRALMKYRDLLAVYKKSPGLDHPNSETALQNLNDILNEKRLKHEDTLQYGRELPDSIHFEGTGDDQARHGEYGEAISSYMRALKIEETVLGQSYLTTAGILGKIADVYRYKGQSDRAIILYRKAIRTYQTFNIPDQEMARTLKNISLAVNGLGFNDSVALRYRKAVKESLKREVNGDKAQQLGNLNRAIAEYTLAIEVEESVLGKLHPTLSSLYRKLGDICRDQGDNESAILFYSKVLAIDESRLGKDNEETVKIFNQLVNVSQKYGTDSGASLDGWTTLKYVLMGLIGLLVLIVSVVKSLSNNQTSIKSLKVSAHKKAKRARKDLLAEGEYTAKSQGVQPLEERFNWDGTQADYLFTSSYQDTYSNISSVSSVLSSSGRSLDRVEEETNDSYSIGYNDEDQQRIGEEILGSVDDSIEELTLVTVDDVPSLASIRSKDSEKVPSETEFEVKLDVNAALASTHDSGVRSSIADRIAALEKAAATGY